jgi:hypothetical protein
LFGRAVGSSSASMSAGRHRSVPRAPGEVARITTWWDQPVELAFHFLDPEVEMASLTAAGWVQTARLEREPMTPTEPQTRRCYLLARRT